jgi:hypothetical protein
MRVKLCTRCPYAPRDISGRYDSKAVVHLCVKCDSRRVASADHYPRKTHRRQECATVFSIDVTAQPIVARSVRDGLASSGTTPGERPSAPESAPTVSGIVGTTTVDFYLVTRLPDSCGDDPAVIFASR